MSNNLPAQSATSFQSGSSSNKMSSTVPQGYDAHSGAATNGNYGNGAYDSYDSQAVHPGPVAPSGNAMQKKKYDWGGNPLAREQTYDEERLQAFGGELQPGMFKSIKDRKLANPAPLGLSAFALTTFVLSLLNMGTRGQSTPNIVVALAYGYGGLVQLLAGMWYVHITRRCYHQTR